MVPVQSDSWRLLALSTADLLHANFENGTAESVGQLLPLIPRQMIIDPFTAMPFEFGLNTGGNLTIRSPFCYRDPSEARADLFAEMCSRPGEERKQLEIVRFVNP